jgi:hypothetical protein
MHCAMISPIDVDDRDASSEVTIRTIGETRGKAGSCYVARAPLSASQIDFFFVPPAKTIPSSVSTLGIHPLNSFCTVALIVLC